MALNLSGAGNVKRLSFGTGVLRLGAQNTTPSTDVGYGRGAQLQVTRNRLEVLQGVPRQLVYQFVQQEDVTFTFTGIEWSLDRLRDVLAISGAVVGAQPNQYLGFGGDTTVRNVSVQFTHQLPVGATADLYIWNAQGQGEMNLNFQDDVHEFPYAFRALVATTAWDNSVLASDQQFFRIRMLGNL